jgi:hypothetical protein
VAFLATGAAAVILLNPLALLHPDLLAAHARRHLASSGWGYGSFGAEKLAHFAAHLAGRDLALAALPLVLAGLLAAARRPAPFRTYIVLVSLCVFVLLGGFVGVPRIVVVVAPLLALIAGFGAAWLASASRPPLRLAGTLFVALCVAGLAVDVTASAESFRRPDPGEQAAAWIRDHVEAGACLTLRADRPLATFLPRFDLLRYRLRRLAIEAPVPEPGPEGGTILLSAGEEPEQDPAAAWIAPRGPYRLLARFPAQAFAPPGLLLRGPHRPRTVLVISAPRREG